jgi:hypothetical protein
LTLSSLIFSKIKEIGELTPIDIPILNQMVVDWQRIPYTDMQVVENDASCPDAWEPVFNITWHGTTIGCQVNDTYVLTAQDFAAQYGSSQVCHQIDAIESVV